MDKKIGNYIQLLLLLLSFVGSLYGNTALVSLSLQDLEQNSIRQAEVGVPFVLQVVATNMENPQLSEPVQGFDTFHVTQHGSSHSVSIINGTRTERTTLNYVLRTDKKGSYKIGPIRVIGKNNVSAITDALTIAVGDRVVGDKNRKQQYFLQVDLPKKSVYVGEKVDLKIKFYYTEPFDGIKIIHQEFEKFHVDTVSDKPVEKEEDIDGVHYKYYEWVMSVYPESAGVHLIPQMQAAFKASSMHVFDFFNFSSERVVQSAPRSVEVTPLPVSETYKDVSAVGRFDSAQFALQHSHGDVGQGIVATYRVQGQGNFSFMKAPALQLPAGLHYYESNSSVKKLSNGQSEKTFEYIIQADRGSKYEIQAQRFIYFDPEKGLYKTLQTNTASLDVAEVMTAKSEEEQYVQDLREQKKYQFEQGQISFVQESGFVSESDSDSFMQKFLGWLIQALSFLSLLAAMYWVYVTRISGRLSQSYWMFYIQSYVVAYKLYYQGDTKELYNLLRLIITRYGFQDLQQEELKNFIEQYTLQSFQSWNLFVHDITRELFSKESVSLEQKQKNSKHVVFWIKLFLKHFRHMQSAQKSIRF